MRAIVLALSCLALIAAFTVIVRASDDIVRLPVEEVIVTTETGDITFSTELATDEASRSRGLMFRRELAEKDAMLFYWQTPQVASMWMRNTYIPLDMLFVQADGTILHIATDTVPHSLEVVSADRLVSAVMEINAGLTKRFNIKPGSRLIHRFFNRS
ncbi:MAG: DUF192 domain-containing protein [Anderseniella sp.]